MGLADFGTMPAEERPLYRLHHHGTQALANSELLALLLGTAEAPGLSQDLLTHFGSLHNLARANKVQMMRIHGIGQAQAGRLIALLELSRRLQARTMQILHPSMMYSSNRSPI